MSTTSPPSSSPETSSSPSLPGAGDRVGSGCADETLRAALDALPLHIFIKDSESRYLFCNRALAAVFGTTGEAMLGRDDRDYFPAELAAAFRDDDRRMMNERETRSYEEPFHRDGEDGWIRTTKLPWFTEAGDVGGIIGFFSDITPHKRAERAEARYATIIQTSLDAFVIVGDAGQLLEVNDATCRLTGYTREELLQMTLRELEAQQSAEEIARNIELLMEKGSGVFESAWCCRGGEVVAIEVSVCTLDEGEGARFFAFVRDISARKRAEDRLRTFLRAIEQSPVATAITDSSGHIEYVNPRHAQITGIPSEEAIGSMLRILPGGKDAARDRARMWAALKTSGVWRRELLNRQRDGSEYWVDASVSVITDDDGRITHYVAAKEDISQRKRIELALARKTAMYALLSRVNNAIVKSTDAGRLFAEICRDAVALGGFTLAWIGRVEADGHVAVASSFGVGDCADYPATVAIHVSADLPSGRGATGTAIRENRPVVNNQLLEDAANNPWHSAAERYDLHSSIALPIAGGDFRGALNIYSRVEGHFDEDIIALLKEVAGDISFALRKIADTASRERAEAQLALYAQVFGNSSDGMTITDAENRIVAVNQSFVDITGYTREDVIGQNPRLLASGRHGREFYENMWSSLNEHGSWQGEIWNRRKNGDLFPEWVTINVVRDRDGKITNHFAVFSDLVQKKAAEELSRLKRFDALTGLPNPLMMEDRICEAIVHARQHGRYVGLMFINLDHFHMVNDLFGHVAGDQVLRHSAQRLVDVVGTRGTVSRFSGDIFVVALPDLNASSEINPLAAAMLTAIAEPYSVDGQAINLSARIGIAVYPNDGDDFTTLMKNADAALLDAKIGGKNSFRFFTARMNEHAQRLLTIGGELRDAIREQRLLLHYQPQVDLGNGRIVGFEALVRIAHPERGLIPPGDFIPIAEENGMINELGNWVIDEACRQRRAWLDAGLGDFVVAINLSALQLGDPALPAFVRAALARHGIPGHLIELEFTESALMKKVGHTLGLMNEFRALGLRLSIDDFGTGYSSLSYLRQFPLDKLKIDQSFVRNLADRGSDASIVQAVIALARALRLSTIAEGVETEAQRAELQLLGCDEMQGYLFSRPLPAAAASALLQGRR